MKFEVAIPCYNEEQTIADVVRSFRASVPEADVVVYDNNSSDATAARAREAGGRVVRVPRQGKGCVVQSIFATSDADVVLIVDGDGTYEASDAGLLIGPVAANEADMAIGTRLHASTVEFRRMHHFGNRVLTWMLNAMFGTSYRDILSGYRAFSRRFRERVPLIGTGFEIETELMVQALVNGMAVREVPIGFRARPPGSASKLSSFRDGYRILVAMIVLLRDHRPLFTFSLAALVLTVIGALVWGAATFYFASAPYAGIWRSIGAFLIQFSAGLVLVGLILNTINTRMRELMSLIRRRQ